jgi:hypothetical protein
MDGAAMSWDEPEPYEEPEPDEEVIEEPEPDEELLAQWDAADEADRQYDMAEEIRLYPIPVLHPITVQVAKMTAPELRGEVA